MQFYGSLKKSMNPPIDPMESEFHRSLMRLSCESYGLERKSHCMGLISDKAARKPP